MNSQLKYSSLEAFDQETVDHVADMVNSRSKPGRSKELVNGSRPPLSQATYAAQQLRFRAAAFFLLTCVGGFLFRHIIGVRTGEPLDLWLLGLYMMVVFVLGFSSQGSAGCQSQPLGQYRLIAPLGAGGMGEVYLAEHCMLKRPCAIKVIHPEQAGDTRVMARFEREVCMTARLSHWNTVEVFDYGRTEDGTLFYVMEYLPGLSLEELLQRHGSLPAGRVIHLLQQACQGLREAHAIGLIHRDIKPANIFAAQRGGLYDVVKLLDFGLVKSVAERPSARLTREGSLSGTPLYMSPEQARGLHELDARSDIYSLGAVAYTLLCGRPPFDRESPLDVIIAHVRDEVVPPSKIQTDVPADLERIILRCLAKNPEDRFQDTAELDQALSECDAAGNWTQADAAIWWRSNVPSTEPVENRLIGRIDDWRQNKLNVISC